jgi:hypothetical protein
MPLRTFLTALAPVAARHPAVFVEACRATIEIQSAPCLHPPSARACQPSRPATRCAALAVSLALPVDYKR